MRKRRICSTRDALVADCYHLDSRRLTWDVQFHRGFHDWELAEVAEFLALFYSQVVEGVGMDEIVWVGTPRRVFEVRAFYHSLMVIQGPSFPWKAIWRLKAPLKVAFFAWCTVLNSILTLDNLKRRLQIVVNWCCMCKKTEATVNHLLLHCQVARDVWSMILVAFGMSWVFPRTTLDTIEAWKGCIVESRARVGWRATPLCLWWVLWCERNMRSFEGEETPIWSLKYSILHTLFFWVNGRNCKSLGDLLDFVDSLKL
ncbi:uncharacterized protein LOC132309059 [Cornus florida]|uniref:uncharacterized protein LOC132309059 n=1 Tax=Cornus florida TaxID=4283 RepID=UPI00289A92DD|nr:uncharacterized protein LOC132309059 [Cornus florida]